MWNGDSGMIFGGLAMWLFWILLIVVIVVVIKVLIGPTANPPSQPESPLDILKKRYARGEIDEQEYERRRRELED
jgi:putative membrane protein